MSEKSMPAERLLAAEFRRIAAADRVARRAPDRLRPAAIALAVLLIGASVAAAATTVLSEGEPLRLDPYATAPAELQPAPGTARLDSLRVADPTGGSSWGVVTSRGQTGLTCVAAGLVVGDRVGLVDGKQVRPLDLEHGGNTCGDPAADGYLVATAVRQGASPDQMRTLVYGVATERVTSIDLVGPFGERSAKPSPRGGFLVVIPDAQQPGQMQLTVSFADGTSRHSRF